MWLKTLQINNYRCFRRLELSFDSSLTVLVAENGQGKTSILEAAACLLGKFVSSFGVKPVPGLKDVDYRDVWSIDTDGNLVKDVRAPVMSISALADVTGHSVWNNFVAAIPWEVQRTRDGAEKTKASVRAYGMGVAEIRRFAHAFVQADNEHRPVPYPIIAFYGTERFVPRLPVVPGKNYNRGFVRSDAYSLALNGSLNYKKLVDWLLHVENQQLREIVDRNDFSYQSLAKRTIEKALSLVMPNFSNLRAYESPVHLEVDVQGEAGKSRLLVDQQLSDGHKIVLTMVLDLVSRILEANGCLPDMSPEALLGSRGIVMIDEVDLHLHPSWQQHIVTDLLRAFPNMQFIITTHSPHVVSSIPRESLRIVTADGVVPFTQPTQGVEVSDILRAIFGTNPTPQHVEIVGKLNRLIELTSGGLGETEEWHAIYGELVAYYGEDYGPLLGAVRHKEFLKRLEEERNA